MCIMTSMCNCVRRCRVDPLHQRPARGRCIKCTSVCANSTNLSFLSLMCIRQMIGGTARFFGWGHPPRLEGADYKFSVTSGPLIAECFVGQEVTGVNTTSFLFLGFVPTSKASSVEFSCERFSLKYSTPGFTVHYVR